MAISKEDLAFYNELGAFIEEFTAAKEAHQANPNDEAAAARWRAAKEATREHRRYWREIRRYQLDLALAGDAEAMAKVQADIGEGGAIAAPAPVGGSATPQGV